jgi:hypothetical protein
MTQLDSVTWVSQVTCLFICFFSLYILVYKNYAPFSFYNQMLRSQKIASHYKLFISYDYLNVDTRFKYFNIIATNF